MFDSILVATDGSDPAKRAAAHAGYFAEAFDATVHVLSVVDLDAQAGPFSAGGVGESYRERLEAAAMDRIRETEQALGNPPDTRIAVETGRPTERILGYAEEHDLDLVVLGTSGRTGIQRYVMGSVAERVVCLADVPVLTAQADDKNSPVEGYDDILVPTDGSGAALAAVDPALAIAECCDARIHAVSVINLASITPGSNVDVPAEVVEHFESRGRDATETVAELAAARGLETATDLVQGTPAECILEYADTHDVDLLSMGTQGRTGLSRHLLGSTTEKVIRHAEFPVLAVDADE